MSLEWSTHLNLELVIPGEDDLSVVHQVGRPRDPAAEGGDMLLGEFALLVRGKVLSSEQPHVSGEGGTERRCKKRTHSVVAAKEEL